jgi:hypothetical protein
MGRCLCALGYVSLREGDLAGAWRDLSDGLRLVAPPAYRPSISRFLAYLALLAIREGDAARSARLVGAAEAVNPYMRSLLPPDQLADLDASLATARAVLGEEAFARAWAEGQAMSLKAAVEHALHG